MPHTGIEVREEVHPCGLLLHLELLHLHLGGDQLGAVPLCVGDALREGHLATEGRLRLRDLRRSGEGEEREKKGGDEKSVSEHGGVLLLLHKITAERLVAGEPGEYLHLDAVGEAKGHLLLLILSLAALDEDEALVALVGDGRLGDREDAGLVRHLYLGIAGETSLKCREVVARDRRLHLEEDRPAGVLALGGDVLHDSVVGLVLKRTDVDSDGGADGDVIDIALIDITDEEEVGEVSDADDGGTLAEVICHRDA